MRNSLKSSLLWFAVTALVMLLVGLWLTLWQWDWLRSGGSETASNSDTLRNAGLMLGGILALIFALWRGWVAQQQSATARRQADIAQQSLLNERYERGAEMLGSPVLSVRLGGIYALRRLAEEHTELYHIQIVELFCAFLRNPTSSEESRGRENNQTLSAQTASPVREDVQVALTTVGGRTKVGLDIEKATGRFRLDLHNADLSRVHLPGANLAYANLGGADLRGAYLGGTNLSHVYLQGAKLERANLIHANFSRAHMGSADLSGVLAQNTDFSGAGSSGNLSDADFRWANFSGANIGTSNLENSNLEGANFSGTIFGTGTRVELSEPPISEDVFARLTQRQLNEACADPNNPPKIPAGTVDVESGKQLVWCGKRSENRSATI